jgi:phosphonate transport system substrate-binding protein
VSLDTRAAYAKMPTLDLQTREASVKRITTLLAAASVASFAMAAEPSEEKGALTMGIGTPNGEAQAQKTKPLVEAYLSQALKRTVTGQVVGSYDDLTQALVDGKVDLAWITPVAFVKASTRNAQVTALAKAIRGGNVFYRAAFIVKQDAPGKSLADFKGKKVAWVSRSSASGYIFPRAVLKSKGEDPAAFFGSEMLAGDHPAVCKAVRDGTVDVGATFADEPAPGEALRATGCNDAPPVADFRVIGSSGPIPNDVIATRPDFDERLVNTVLRTFARMSDSEGGRAILKEVFRVEGWGIAVDGDFQTVIDALEVKAPAKVSNAQIDKDEGPKPAKKTKSKGAK